MTKIIEEFLKLSKDETFKRDVSKQIKDKLLSQVHNKFFTIVPGIESCKRVADFTPMELVTFKDQSFTGIWPTPELPAFSQSWNLYPMRVCFNCRCIELEARFKQWSLTNHKLLDKAAFRSFLQTLIADVILSDSQRVALYGDKDIAAKDILSDPTKSIHFDQIKKGLIPTLEYFKTLDDFKGNFITLEQNKADKQFEFTPDYAKNLYEELVDADDFEGNMLLTSNKLYRNYASFFKNHYLIQSSRDEIQKGVRNLTVDGENIVPYKSYDIWNKKYFNKEGKQHLPHFAIYTKKEYLQIGIGDEEFITDLTLEHVGLDECFYIKGKYRMDFKITNPYEFKAAI